MTVLPTQVPRTSSVSPEAASFTASCRVVYVVPVPAFVTSHVAAADGGTATSSVPPTRAMTDATEPSER